jgi:hypothetical protein
MIYLSVFPADPYLPHVLTIHLQISWLILVCHILCGARGKRKESEMKEGREEHRLFTLDGQMETLGTA